jgi:hypothetical protein
MRTPKKRSANHTRFRPGATGECEAQLWTFTASPGILNDDDGPQVHWVAAESLDAALRYMRLRYDDFNITEARFLGMIPLLSGSPRARPWTESSFLQRLNVRSRHRSQKNRSRRR